MPIAIRIAPGWRRRLVIAAVALVVVPPAWLFAQLPYTFARGEIADANQVNDNFEVLRRLLALTGNRCAADAVRVGDVCVDRYEASVWGPPGGPFEDTQYGVGSDDYPCADDGQDCTAIVARSLDDFFPARYITWFQAQQACSNAGKRLLTNAEWQRAVAGTPDLDIDNGTTDCNTGGNVVAASGSRSACVSSFGVFDMVGNLNEWVADWVPASTDCFRWSDARTDFMCLSGASTTATGPGALVRGGDYVRREQMGDGPLAVFGNIEPQFADENFGFRCARSVF